MMSYARQVAYRTGLGHTSSLIWLETLIATPGSLRGRRLVSLDVNILKMG